MQTNIYFSNQSSFSGTHYENVKIRICINTFNNIFSDFKKVSSMIVHTLCLLWLSLLLWMSAYFLFGILTVLLHIYIITQY